MAQERKRTAGRPAVPVLSRDIIAEAALQLVSDSGAEKLTMTRLAKMLNVSPSAIYNHIANKSDLILIVQDELMGRVSTRGFDEILAGEHHDLDAALTDWSYSYRRVFSENTALIPVIAVTPVSGAPKTLQMYDTVAGALMRCGMAEEHVMATIISFESFLFGSALDVNAPQSLFSTAKNDPELESLRVAFQALRASSGASGDEGATNPYSRPPFEFGLRALIAATLAHTSVG